MCKSILFRLFAVLLLVISSTVAFAGTTPEDVVYLKNGSVIHGMIIEQKPNVSLKIKTHDGNVFVFETKDIDRIVRESTNSSSSSGKKTKSPGVALALSFLVPGLGQYYNGEYKKGIIQNALVVSGYVMVIGFGSAYYTETHQTYDSYYGQYGYGTTGYDANTAWLWVGAGTILGTAVWSMIDAVRSAHRINRNLENAQIRTQAAPLSGYASRIHVAPALSMRSPGVAVTLNF